MLTDEEKEAIEKLSGKKNETTWDDTIRQIKREEIKDVVVTRQKYITAVLKLIEKQSKEIEHQKEKRENQKKELAVLNAKQIEFNKLVNTVNSYKGQFKKQQKEIEELKEESNKYYYEWKHLEANVINKIQEYDDKGMTVNLVNRSAGKTFQQAVHYEVKKVLQSLLEKE